MSKKLPAKKLRSYKKGFTLIELLVTIGILGMLVGFSSWAYLNIQKNSDLSSQTNLLVASLRQAQNLAISHQTSDQDNILDAGVHFTANSYTIFYGSIYNPDDNRNITTNLPSGISLAYTLPTPDLVFIKGSGEIFNYNPAYNFLTITNSTGQSHRIEVNKLGVVNVD